MLFSAERAKAFTDAVVAIAITLLILPLMESVGAAAAAHESTSQWFSAEIGQLTSFALSFMVIANFWTSHHRVFDGVTRMSNTLLWITIAWMFTIVWLPVATALVGQIPNDPLQIVLYIGTMLLASLLLVVTRLYLRAHPDLHDIAPDALRRGTIAELVAVFLFALALTLALVFPGLSYWPMFLLVLIRPLYIVVTRFIARRKPAG